MRTTQQSNFITLLKQKNRHRSLPSVSLLVKKTLFDAYGTAPRSSRMIFLEEEDGDKRKTRGTEYFKSKIYKFSHLAAVKNKK